MKNILSNPVVKGLLTVIAGVFVAAPTIPALAGAAPILEPLGGLIAGWLHLPQPVKP
jgi:hypothetical protein